MFVFKFLIDFTIDLNSARGGETNEKIVEYYHTALASKLDAYEVILAKQKYLAGDVSSISYCVSSHPAHVAYMLMIDGLLNCNTDGDTRGYIPSALWRLNNPGTEE